MLSAPAPLDFANFPDIHDSITNQNPPFRNGRKLCNSDSHNGQNDEQITVELEKSNECMRMEIVSENVNLQRLHSQIFPN